MLASLAPATTKNRKQCWVWAEDRSYERLGRDELGRLPKGAADVAELLSSHVHEWRRVDYQDLHRRTGLNQRQVRARLNELQRLGMFEVAIHRHRYGVVDATVWPARLDEGYGTQVWARPAASFIPTINGVVAYVSAHARWLLSERKTAGGKRPGAGRPSVVGKSKASVTPGSVDQGSTTYEPGGKSKASVLSDLESGSGSDLSSPSEKKGASKLAPPPGWDQSSDPEEADLASLLPFDGPKAHPIPVDQRGPLPVIPTKDPIPQFSMGHPLIPEGATAPTKVQILVESFNASAKERFGREAGMAFGSSDPSKSKHYPALLAAAEVLVEHDISPRAWADWRLDFAKQANRRMGLTQVFQAATIAKLRGYFRRNHDEPFGIRMKPERYHREQMFREREAWARWEWGDSGRADELPPMTCERWYHDMRVQERRAGQLDPLEEWPSKRGPRRAG